MNWDKIGDISGLKIISKIGTANIIGNAISALFWLYLAGLLGTKNYGELSYFIAIAGIGTSVTLLGGPQSITVYVAKGIKIQPPIYLVSIVSSAIAAIVLFFSFDNIGVSFYVVGAVIYNLAVSEFLGRKLYKKYSMYFILQKILFVLFSLTLYYLIGPQGVLVGVGLSFSPFAIQIYRTFKEIKLDFSVLKNRMGFITNNYFLDLITVSASQIDKLVIGPFFGFALLGNYYLALQVLALFSMVPEIVVKYTLPEDASGKSTRSIKIITVFSSFILAALGFFIAPILIPIFFLEYENAVDLIPIISLAIIPITITSMYTSKFLGEEKSRYLIASNVIAIIILILGIFSLGEVLSIKGIAIAFVLSGAARTIYLVVTDFMRNKN